MALPATGSKETLDGARMTSPAPPNDTTATPTETVIISAAATTRTGPDGPGLPTWLPVVGAAALEKAPSLMADTVPNAPDLPFTSCDVGFAVDVGRGTDLALVRVSGAAKLSPARSRQPCGPRPRAFAPATTPR